MPNSLPLVEELSPVPDVGAVLKALEGWPAVVLFDSARRGPDTGRYSFLTADPFHFERLDGAEFVGRDPQTGGALPGDPLIGIERRMRDFQAETVSGLPPFQGGAAGILAYDLNRAWERLPPPRRDEFALPALAAGLYDWVLAWDHDQNRAWIISQGFPESTFPARNERAHGRLRHVRAALAGNRNHLPLGGAPQRRVPGVHEMAPHYPAPGLPGLVSNFSRDAYLRAVERAIEYIHAGDIFQVNLSQRLLWPLDRPPLELYSCLRDQNPAPFAGYVACDDWVLASASPERFVRVAGREVDTRPIKGTRQRRLGPEADLFTRDELRESEKDQAENLMIVDLLRNDLSRVCTPGSVRVPELCRVETYATVQHLVSEVRGRLDPSRSIWDVWRAVFPGGSITGAPKVRSMEIIAELEPTARGPYCGSLFYVGFDGQTDSSILIRTFIIRQGWVQCPVGGGIVAQSDPASEYEETLVKAEGMLLALRGGGAE